MNNKIIIEAISNLIELKTLAKYEDDEILIGGYDWFMFKYKGAKAFELIPEFISIRKYISDPKQLELYIGLVLEIVSRSNTTELPIGMVDFINENRSIGGINDLKKWYRINLI